MPPQHRSIIALRALGLRKPEARRMMERILLLIPSAIEKVTKGFW
jgi:hypothetical protein